MNDALSDFCDAWFLLVVIQAIRGVAGLAILVFLFFPALLSLIALSLLTSPHLVSLFRPLPSNTLDHHL